jgi:hypothetical protein
LIDEHLYSEASAPRTDSPRHDSTPFGNFLRLLPFLSVSYNIAAFPDTKNLNFGERKSHTSNQD